MIKFSLTIHKGQNEIIVRLKNSKLLNEILNGHVINDNKRELRRHLLINDKLLDSSELTTLKQMEPFRTYRINSKIKPTPLSQLQNIKTNEIIAQCIKFVLHSPLKC